MELNEKLTPLAGIHIKVVSIIVMKETLVTGICHSYLIVRSLKAKVMIVGLP